MPTLAEYFEADGDVALVEASQLERKPKSIVKLLDSTPPLTVSLLPSVVADYLNLLLQSSTEVREQHLDKFDCLRCQAGDHVLLIPLDRIARIEKLKKKRKFYGADIPECDGEENFVLNLHGQTWCIYLKQVLDVISVNSSDIKWRSLNNRAPWFVGTHKSMLCRIFDPNFLIHE